MPAGSKWSYRHIQGNDMNNVVRQCAASGNSGWELVSIVVIDGRIHAVMKMPK
ncbi:MAG: hypothetical protein ACYTEQ_24280 [Planctomycetota bacterium]